MALFFAPVFKESSHLSPAFAMSPMAPGMSARKRLLDTFPDIDKGLLDVFPGFPPMAGEDVNTDQDNTRDDGPGDFDDTHDFIPHATKYGRDLRPVRAYEIHDGEDSRSQAVPQGADELNNRLDHLHDNGHDEAQGCRKDLHCRLYDHKRLACHVVLLRPVDDTLYERLQVRPGVLHGRDERLQVVGERIHYPHQIVGIGKPGDYALDDRSDLRQELCEDRQQQTPDGDE